VQRLGRSGHRTSLCTMPRRKCLNQNLQPVKRIASSFGNAAKCSLVPNELRALRCFAADILLNNVNRVGATDCPATNYATRHGLLLQESRRNWLFNLKAPASNAGAFFCPTAAELLPLGRVIFVGRARHPPTVPSKSAPSPRSQSVLASRKAPPR
jgi:hypothetical protein